MDKANKNITTFKVILLVVLVSISWKIFSPKFMPTDFEKMFKNDHLFIKTIYIPNLKDKKQLKKMLTSNSTKQISLSNKVIDKIPSKHLPDFTSELIFAYSKAKDKKMKNLLRENILRIDKEILNNALVNQPIALVNSLKLVQSD